MERITKIITIANHKGGVGKTTTTASLGAILSSKGMKVLLIDLDAQANLTCSVLKGEVEGTVYDSFVSSSPLPIYEVKENLDISPADLQLARADLQLAAAIARESILSRLLAPVKGKYDYILIDCPPSLGVMTLNAVTASDYVLIPMIAEVLPFNGLKMISDFIGMIKDQLNPKVDILGILITRWENTNLAKSIEAGLRDKLGDKVFKTKIRKNVTVAQAPLLATTIVDYDSKSNGALDYTSFTEEFLERV